MNVFETTHAEPRGTSDCPTYRVNFWERPQPGYAWNLDAFTLTEAHDVREVVLWIKEHARGRRFELFAEADDEPQTSFVQPRTAHLVRLLGTSPN